VPWDSIENVPENVKTHQDVPLTLEQANKWAEIFDALEGQEGIDDPAAVAWSTWMKLYKKNDDGTAWVKIEESSLSNDVKETGGSDMATTFGAEIIQQILDKHAPEAGEPKVFVAFVKDNWDGGWRFSQTFLMDTLSEEVLAKALYEGEWRMYEAKPEIAEDLDNLRGFIAEMPEGGLSFVVKRVVESAEFSEGGTTKDILTMMKEKLSDGKEVSGCCGAAELREATEDDLTNFAAAGVKDLPEKGAEVLIIKGLAIAKGTWKGWIFEEDALKESAERILSVRIDVEHADTKWEDVMGFIFKQGWDEERGGITVEGLIFDERVITWYKENTEAKLGLSVRLNPDTIKFEKKDEGSLLTFIDYLGMALTMNPACKVCFLDDASCVSLSDAERQDDGEIQMADPKEKPEEGAGTPPQPEEPEPSSPAAKPGEEEAADDNLSDKLKLSEQTNEKLTAEKDELTQRLSDAESQLKLNTAELEKNREAARLKDIEGLVDESIRLGTHKPADRDDIIQFANDLPDLEKVKSFLTLSTGKVWSDEESEAEEEEKDEKLSAEPGHTVIT